jgi:hypothetical protein
VTRGPVKSKWTGGADSLKARFECWNGRFRDLLSKANFEVVAQSQLLDQLAPNLDEELCIR